MLLNFRFKNFRSFYEEQEISMLATRITEYEDYLIKEDDYSVLPSAIIYGANASGKTNIIKAFKFLKAIITAGTISKQNSEDIVEILELLPFIHDKAKHDNVMNFEIEVKIAEYIYLYEIGIKSNIEMIQDECERCVANESLHINGTEIFTRKNNEIDLNINNKVIEIFNSIEDNDKDENITEHEYSKQMQYSINSVKKNISKEELFIARGFKNTISSKSADLFIDWITFSLNVYENYDEMNYIAFNEASSLRKEKNEEDNNTLFANKFWNAFYKNADFGPQDIVVKTDKSGIADEVYSLYEVKNIKQKFVIPSVLMESTGTMNIHKLSDILLYTLMKGSVLVIDEIGSSMHPDLIISIIRVFNDLEINRYGAQLIMTSHNPVLLGVFRRDQIYLVEKDKSNYQSNLYTIYDFSDEKVRKDANLMKNYIKGHYGAVPNSDFSKAIKKYFDDYAKFVLDKGN